MIDCNFYKDKKKESKEKKKIN